MAILIACLGEGKGTWQTVFKLAAMPEWEKVLLVGPAFAREHLQLKENMEFLTVDDTQPVPRIAEMIQQKLGAVFGEVGVNLTSGNGNLHMAVLSAVLKSGGGVKLVHYGAGFEEL